MTRVHLGPKTLLPILAGGVVRSLLLFVPAGTVRWWQGWAFILSLSGLALLGGATLVQDRPELLEERRTAAKKAKRWDKPLVLLAVGVLPQLELVVAGLDHRWSWTHSITGLESGLALVLVLGSNLTGFWAMRSNAFFSSFARIQDDRGHRVEVGGPYRYVRHPAYIGWTVSALATGVLLGSVLAIGVGGAIGVLIVVRTALEDRMLLTELGGYQDYAARVRYRLVPHVW